MQKRLPKQTFLHGVSFLKLSALLAGEEPQGGGGAEHLAYRIENLLLDFARSLIR